MSEKKYDLSQVSQATKDAFCQASIDFDCNEVITYVVLREAKGALYLEAEVKPKTARAILKEYLDEPMPNSNYKEEFDRAVKVVSQALDALEAQS